MQILGLFQVSNSYKASEFYSTSDFTSFTQLTADQPQDKYNWLYSELVNFKGLDGSNIQGILYKPENFDLKKRYPVIFHFYENVSQNLHIYEPPHFAGAAIDIPWFVSRGYVVFYT